MTTNEPGLNPGHPELSAGTGYPGVPGKPGLPGTTDGHGGAGGAGGSGGQGGTAGDEGHGGPGGTGGIGGVGGPGSPANQKIFRKLLWAIVVLFVVSFAIGAGNLLFTNSQVRQVARNTDALRQQVQINQVIITKERQQIQADCSFYIDLSGLPVTNTPGGHPSELGVKIISDSRAAWHGHGCPGKLAAPDPTYVAGAAYYHLPVN